ncbi:unnamed protein product [Notodromas monacha]|uniref:Major facilitator superfamily (MFS) profile domain-containing protein n=1 Tax=Notodromas monacha TaxID=399045 RepID=A0A7R9GB96_9CRUS|nr:unnamed protein product [Notodromas monacha]CAG0914574.1 unnamed protein product [Notodromas monacha]
MHFDRNEEYLYKRGTSERHFLLSCRVEGLDEVIHNPATLGAVEQREIIARNTLTDWGHEMTCRCSLCLRNMTLIRTNAHDNMKTSNAANTALAYAWPFLVAADEPAEMTGTAKQVRRPKDIFTANTLAIVPNEENRRKILGRKVPADRGEPIAFLEKLSDNSIPLPSFRLRFPVATVGAVREIDLTAILTNGTVSRGTSCAFALSENCEVSQPQHCIHACEVIAAMEVAGFREPIGKSRTFIDRLFMMRSANLRLLLVLLRCILADMSYIQRIICCAGFEERVQTESMAGRANASKYSCALRPQRAGASRPCPTVMRSWPAEDPEALIVNAAKSHESLGVFVRPIVFSVMHDFGALGTYLGFESTRKKECLLAIDTCPAIMSCLLVACFAAPRKFFQRRLSYETKKKCTITLVFLANFLGGTEFAIILPTVWQYLQSVGIHDETYMGYVTSAFSFSGMFSGLILGRIADATYNIRKIALIVNLTQILGQFLYFLGNDAHILILGRFVNGIGVGMNSALYADVIRGTEPAERSRVLTGIFMTRQISIVLAPAYNIVLRHLPTFSYDVTMFGMPVTFALNELSASGFVMCILWIIYEILVYLIYFNIAEEIKTKRRSDRASKRKNHSRNSPPPIGVYEKVGLLTKGGDKSRLIDADDEAEEPNEHEEVLVLKNGSKEKLGYETFPSSPKIDNGDTSTVEFVVPSKGRSENSDSQSSNDSVDIPRADCELYKKEFFRPAIIALLFMQMTSLFMQTMTETIVPPLLQEYFNYGTAENSIFFMIIGVEFVAVYIILLMILGKKEGKWWTITEQHGLIFSSIAMNISLCGFWFVAYYLTPGRAELLYAFGATCMILFLAVATTSVSSVALIAHVLDARAQGAAFDVLFRDELRNEKLQVEEIESSK